MHNDSDNIVNLLFRDTRLSVTRVFGVEFAVALLIIFLVVTVGILVCCVLIRRKNAKDKMGENA